MTAITETIRSGGILPVVTLERIEYAVPLARAVAESGLPGMEVVFRSACAADAIRTIRNALPGLLLGAGTILNCDQVNKAIDAGADFLVSPGFAPKVVSCSVRRGIPIYPGVTTPTEIEQAMEYGLDVLKFFPAETSGGVDKLKSFAGPYKNIRFIPTGGINEKNFKEYLALDNVVAVGGSFMIASTAMASGQFDAVKAELDRIIAMMLGLNVVRVGIHHTCAADALDSAKALERAFYKIYSEGDSSFLCGAQEFELMKTDGRGTHGQIAIGVADIDRAIRFLNARGVAVDMDSLQITNGKKTGAFLKNEIGGFAFRLIKQ